MERLTNRKTKLAKGGPEPSMLDVVHKLAEYEDLEEQGKLLKLPCAVGDSVYTNRSMQGCRKDRRPYKGTIAFIGIDGKDDFINVKFGDGYMMQFRFSDIGRIVFLTREEAKKDL